MKKFPLFLFSGLILFCFLSSTDAGAFEASKTDSGKLIKWAFPQETYRINASGGPSGSIKAIRRSAATWTNVTGSSFIFIYGGKTTSTAYGINDGENLMNFGKLPLGTLAENYNWYNPITGRVYDSDIKFNTRYKWATTGVAGYYDVQNIATHEMGHSLSLADLYGPGDTAKTMYGYSSESEIKKRSLTRDDINGIKYLYP
ncbi:matrixin family metalloprotease [Desulforhabdus amnigena]|jgi:predicted Zn-dependent protease|uniref:Peptidase M10 metallopeptidase domain-containing protein n=1 Tax=Desulforhabdus amnigena TaxID=40218 RepID=A0A9W6FTV2_9BACT|nr:matrixin family metalloprotease [Desulforhabdus amnigena]NLJ27820.1 matrixin family metalloprotease [Deltaproteobacteria bacterium]GLI34281.1 hypothetical protein DAMNIGENAA_17140 [Desulforhabdus amnigena]